MSKNNKNHQNNQSKSQVIENQTEEIKDEVTETVEDSNEITQETSEIIENKVDESKVETEVKSENKDETKVETKENKETKKTAVRFLTKDILAISIVDKKEVRLFEKMKVELVADDGELCTIKSNEKYYRVPKSILF